jgi:MFS family permease
MQDHTKSATRWVVLFTLVMGMAVMNIGNFVFSTNPVPMMAKFNMDQAQMTALTTVALLPGAFFSVFLGNYFDKKGPKAVRYVGAAMIGLAALCQLARVFVDNYTLLVIITFVSGTLFLPTQVLPAKLIGAWFSAEENSLAMGIYSAAAGTGVLLAFALGALVPDPFWSLFVCFLAFVLVTVLWVFFGRLPEGAPTPEEQPAQQEGGFKAVLKSKNLWLVMICNGIACSMPTLYNAYLINALLAKGFTSEAASILGMVLSAAMIAGSIIQGSIVAKLGKFNKEYFIACMTGGILLFAVYPVQNDTITIIFLVVGGFAAAGGLAVNFGRVGLLPLTGEIGPESIGAAGGMVNTAMGLSGFIFPTVVSAVFGANYMAVFASVFVFFAIIAVIGGFIIPELGPKGELAQKAAANQAAGKE